MALCNITEYCSDAVLAIEVSLGCIGTVGNLLVVCTIVCVNFLHNYTNYFIAHLSVADALVCISIQVFQFRYLPPALVNSATCLLFFARVPFFVFLSVSSFATLCLHAERYIAIVQPLQYPRLVTPAKVKCLLAAIWIVSILTSLFETTSSLTYDESYNVCYITDPDATWKAAFVTLKGVILTGQLVGTIVPYVRIMANLRECAIRQDNLHVDELLEARRRVARLLLFTALAYYLTWIPVAVVYVLLTFGVIVDPTYYDVTDIILLANSMVNPFIYAFKYKEFRKGFAKMCRMGANRVHPVEF